MSELTVSGKVTHILKPQSGTSKAGKDWNKQDFVIETNDQYPKSVCFTLFGDKTDLISKVEVGNDVDVSFNLESKEYNGRWFANVNAWKVVLAEVSQRETNEPMTDIPPEPQQGEDDDLPF